MISFLLDLKRLFVTDAGNGHWNQELTAADSEMYAPRDELRAGFLERHEGSAKSGAT